MIISDHTATAHACRMHREDMKGPRGERYNLWLGMCNHLDGFAVIEQRYKAMQRWRYAGA